MPTSTPANRRSVDSTTAARRSRGSTAGAPEFEVIAVTVSAGPVGQGPVSGTDPTTARGRTGGRSGLIARFRP